MNPETPGTPAGTEPDSEPAATAADVPQQPTTEAAPLPSGGSDVPDTAPDELRELAPDVAPEPPSAAAFEAGAGPVATAAAPGTRAPSAPGLTPAECGARLAELFPALFTAPGTPGPAKPIKLRIHADIQARAPGVFSKRVLGPFFSRYTTTNAYLKALVAAPHRFDLDGEPAGEIAAEHRQAATEELARRHALAAQRRAAQRPPARREAPAAAADASAGPLRDARPPRRATENPEHRPEQARRPARDQRPRHERPAAESRAPSRGDKASRHRDPVAPTLRQPPAREAPAPAALPSDPAQRERAMLLRSFESSPLSKANFCALKGITEAVLDAALQQAKADRGGNGR